jgi:hypothetical protein
MPVNGYTVGKDVTLTIVTPNGVMNLDKITGFRSKQDVITEKRKPLNGITDYLRFFDAWSGSFTLERTDSTLDDYFAALEAGFYAGLTEGPVSITETIQEVSGALSQFRYTRALLSYDDAGEFAGDKTVMQSLSFVSGRRIKIA